MFGVGGQPRGRGLDHGWGRGLSMGVIMGPGADHTVRG